MLGFLNGLEKFVKIRQTGDVDNIRNSKVPGNCSDQESRCSAEASQMSHVGRIDTTTRVGGGIGRPSEMPWPTPIPYCS